MSIQETAQQIYLHIRSAVELILPELNGKDPSSVEEQVHARLWSYVTHAVRDLNPSALNTAEVPAKRDGRAKPWKYVVRFWEVTPLEKALVAESDEEIMSGTGKLPGIVAQYGRDMHSDEAANVAYCPPELSEEAIKEKLPQLRNNLGRQGSAVLRVPYDIGENSFICQVDIISLDA